MPKDYRACNSQSELSFVTITFFDAIDELHQRIHKVQKLIEKLHLINVCIIRATRYGIHQRSNVKSFALSFYSHFKCNIV